MQRRIKNMYNIVKKRFGMPMKPYDFGSILDRAFEGSLLDDVFDDKTFNVDIAENEDEITIKAETPGVKKEDLSVEYTDGVISIKVQKEESSEEEGEKYLRKESRSGYMERSFNIGQIDPENIGAKYADGILNISLKKEKEEPFKKVEIS
jgi:HSP20 family protein